MKLTKNIVSIVTDVIINESEAIKNLVNLITDDFQHVVEAILSCKGRVVITGIGKSAIVANKIVATLNSTGTPALFMHAADAIHGDLGMIQSDDVVICISKSGNTPEIKVLVPLIKSRKTILVGMVGKLDSYLAQQSDYVLDVTVDREACPNNLAPTTSTTATMVLGDALAVALLECRDFSSADFAKLHPGGALGKQLYLRVNDLYASNEKPIVSPEASVKEVILEISSKRLGAAAVLDNTEKLLGIITDGDLRRMLNSHDSFGRLTALDIMTKSPQTVDADTYATAAMALMQSKNITQLIVTKENKFVGFIHIHDLLREGIV